MIISKMTIISHVMTSSTVTLIRRKVPLFQKGLLLKLMGEWFSQIFLVFMNDCKPDHHKGKGPGSVNPAGRKKTTAPMHLFEIKTHTIVLNSALDHRELD